MPLADGNEATSFDALPVLTGNPKGILLDHMVGHCILAGLNNPSTGAIKLTGWCAHTDLLPSECRLVPRPFVVIHVRKVLGPIRAERAAGMGRW